MGTIIVWIYTGLCGALLLVAFFLLLGGEKLISKIQLKLTTEKQLLKKVKFLYENFDSLSESIINNRLYEIMKVLNRLYKKYSIFYEGVRKIKDGCDGKWSECRTWLDHFFYYTNGVEIEPQWEKDEALPIAYHLYKILII